MYVEVHQRTTMNILWSCLATIFACTWVAVHPNIPGPRESEWLRFRRRFATMFYAVIAPEVVTLWAMRQQSSCCKFYSEIIGWFRIPDDESLQWTLSHGFFIQMGGFIFSQDCEPASVITFKQLQHMIDNKIIDLPSLSEEDILDKSKGDLLTKILVVLQMTWFIVQCTGRWATGLPVTELEVVTLAFAFLNIITYSLWWNKPQNVQRAVRITKKSGAPKMEVEPPSQRRTWLERKFAEDDEGSENWLPWMILITLLVPLKVVRDHDITEETGVLFPSLIMSVLFGAIHLIPWVSSSFPSSTERTLWRICACIIAIEPLPVAIGMGLYRLMGQHRIGTVLKMIMEAVGMSLGCLAFIGLPLYVLARFTLLVLAFTTLQSLPPSALQDISWSSFVPHV
ncbi:hypothetical protein AN958_02967 [Leucoagaricus sp. SymC.cos]|nr:hypothetical protein AN958_02967 [Leucoagaricus sp. SymC.cos]